MSQVEKVQDYYGNQLQSSEDLKTSACCPIDAVPPYIRPLLSKVHPTVQSKFYGCGSPIPFVLEGLTVLDLGCGTGRDCYILSQLVGESGNVIGVDMTVEQLDVAKEFLDYHMDLFEYKKPNVDFRHGNIENLNLAGLEDNSVDLVVSNCVINLAEDKYNVFSEIYRVLKPGGQLYFSDIFTSRRVPDHLKNDQILVGECLAGALYKEDFRRLMQQVGFLDFRYMSNEQISLDDEQVREKIGMVDFFSATVSAFKCDLEDKCEDYGHVAYYRGGINNSEHGFRLDDHHYFKIGLPSLVCGNTANMLQSSRYGKFFDVVGDFDTHYGEFNCVDDFEITNQNEGCC